MLSRLFQRIHNDISKPLCMKTFFFGNIIARKFRFSAASQLQRSTTSTISIPRVFLERGSDIPDESKRIKGRHCWSFLEAFLLTERPPLFLSLSLDRGEIVADRILSSPPLPLSRRTRARNYVVSRV